MKVYITINKKTGSYYIGITNGNKKYYLGSGKALHDCIKKYGTKNFRRFTLQNCKDRKEASIQEVFWIKRAKKKWKNKKCLNLTIGGENEYTLSQESRNKIRDKLKKYYSSPEKKEWCRNNSKRLVAWNKEHGNWNTGKGKINYKPRPNGNKGINNRAAKLKESDVLSIRKLYREEKIKQKIISEKYNVKQGLISRIVNNKIWKHI